MTKLIVRKNKKGFDATECQLVDDTLGNKFLDYFLLGNDLILGVKVDVHCFKITPPKIVYQPFSDIHKDKVKKKITQYNKFDTKVPIFVIIKDPKYPVIFCHTS